MKNRTLLCGLAAIALSGCAADQAAMKTSATSFEPTPAGFKYKGVAYVAAPIDTDDGEAWRIRVLEEYLADNHICPKGYDIEARQPIRISGARYDVFYTGRCKT